MTLGNLCVDIVLEVPELPSPDVDQRKLLLRQLAASAPPQEVGLAGGLRRGSLLACSAKLGSWQQQLLCRRSALLLPQRRAELQGCNPQLHP